MADLAKQLYDLDLELEIIDGKMYRLLQEREDRLEEKRRLTILLDRERALNFRASDARYNQYATMDALRDVIDVDFL